jgi:hypothetical protein
MYVLPQAHAVMALCEGLQKGLPVANACILAGVRQSTFDRWIKQGQAGISPFDQLVDTVESAQAEGRRRALRTIRRARRRHWQASAWLLARADPEHWGSAEAKPGRVENASIGVILTGLAELAIPFIPAERQSEFRRRVEELIAEQREGRQGGEGSREVGPC